MKTRAWWAAVVVIGMLLGGAAAARAQAPAGGVTLVQDGQPRAVIVVAEEVMGPDAEGAAQLKNPAREQELQRQRLRESVKDLAAYLQKISGAAVEVVHAAPAGDQRVPILIGKPAADKFGPPAQPYSFAQGFRVVVTPQAIGLSGESDLATSYAIYEVLDRLGCRWYMPSDLGEVIPQQKTITLKEGDESLAPGTIYRTIWYADEPYKRRNRMGGLPLSAGHSLELTGVYLTEEDKKAHPEWIATVDGKPNLHRIKWSNQAVAEHVADRILAKNAENPQPSWSISPDDGLGFDNSPEDKALDAGDFDPGFGDVSITDRFMVLANRIAERVAAKEPDLLLGFLAYVNYTRPPVRESVHPNLVPQVAPITYSRAHPMNMDEVPGNKELRYLTEGWAKNAKQTSWYFYGWFLAEPTAPNPMLRKWGHDVPYVLANGNCKFWQPETQPNFETSMHALYMANRLAFNPALKPQDVYDEINQRFYGSAAAQMTAYWDYIDRVWVDTDDYSGAGFGYLRRWTPERMAESRRLMDAALAAAQTEPEKFRVGLADESLRLFELFMKLRQDQAEGRFEGLAAGAETWLKQITDLSQKYKPQSTFTISGADTLSGSYFRSFYGATYTDATRIATQAQILTQPPLREWKWQLEPQKKEGEAAAAAGPGDAWAAPAFDDSGWKTTDVATQTWSTLGHHDFVQGMRMWYRRGVELPTNLPAGKKVYLWIGSTDGAAKVFVNGKHVPYVSVTKAADGTEKSETLEQAEGYCQPFSFDITDALAKDGKNVVAIRCTRTAFNELGTGGLLAPVVVYQEK